MYKRQVLGVFGFRRGRQGKDNLWQAKKVEFYPKAWQNFDDIWVSDTHSGSSMGTDQNRTNLELGRTIKMLLYSTRKEVLNN